jgi:hypothetical protein
MAPTLNENDMDDLTATRLCAEAMGLREEAMLLAAFATDTTVGWKPKYDPLHDDAQAMALVKRFSPDIEAPYIGQPNWMVVHENGGGCDPDLNRAIVMCVATIREESDK